MKKCMILSLLLAPFCSFGQTVVASGGSYHQGANNSISYTIGEAITSTVTNGSDQLTQGFQQPWVDVQTAIDEPFVDNNTISVYPNPVRHVLHLSFSEQPINNRFELFDAAGKLLIAQNVQSSITDVDMEQFSSGGYFLRVFNKDDTSLKTFKISVAE